MYTPLPATWQQDIEQRVQAYQTGLAPYRTRTNQRREDETMNTTKQQFTEEVTILIDSREKKNQHIVNWLDYWKIRHETACLKYADYSYKVDGCNYSDKFAIERKANVNELFGNVTHDRTRFETEISGLYTSQGGAVILLENCPSLYVLKHWYIDDETAIRQGRKVQNIGETVFCTLTAWRFRYNVDCVCVDNPAHTAEMLLSLMYYHYRQQMQQAKQKPTEQTLTA